MIHLRRPSSSQVPPHASQASTGTLRYLVSVIAPPHPEQNMASPPESASIYDQNLYPATLFVECRFSIDPRPAALAPPPRDAPGFSLPRDLRHARMRESGA